MTTLTRLGGDLAAIRLEDIPPRVIEKVRLQLASALAAAFGSRLDDGAERVRASVRSRGEGGRARILATGEPASLHGAVLANATSTCSFDWDEILLLGHPSHSSVSTAFALAEARGATVGEALLAQACANEVGGRFGLACFFGPQNGQHLPFLHHASAAAAGAKLLGLDGAGCAHALAIALAQPQTALWPAFLGSLPSKVLTAAHPSEVGLSAAEHAAAGLEGPLAIADHERGFFHRFSYLPVRNALTGLGRAWLTDTTEIKTHAACWYFQAALDAAAEVRRQAGGGPLEADDVARIRCRVTLLGATVHALAMGRGASEALHPNAMNFRLDLSVATMLREGRCSPVELQASRLTAREAPLRALAERIEVVHDLELSRRLVGAVHETLDVGALLGGAGLRDVTRALRSARREFQGGLTLPGLSALPRLVRLGLGAARALRGSGRAPYDLGQRAAAIEALALPCGAALEVELKDGRTLEAGVDVPAGTLCDLEGARPHVLDKLRLGVEIAGGDARRAEEAVRAVMETPLDAPAAALLDAVLPRGG